jgi:hypothetical protein
MCSYFNILDGKKGTTTVVRSFDWSVFDHLAVKEPVVFDPPVTKFQNVYI